MREPGYYWVKYQQRWVIAKYGTQKHETLFSKIVDIFLRPINEWEPLPHINHEFNHRFVSEHDLDQINETRIKNPDETASLPLEPFQVHMQKRNADPTGQNYGVQINKPEL